MVIGLSVREQSVIGWSIGLWRAILLVSEAMKGHVLVNEVVSGHCCVSKAMESHWLVSKALFDKWGCG